MWGCKVWNVSTAVKGQKQNQVIKKYNLTDDQSDQVNNNWRHPIKCDIKLSYKESFEPACKKMSVDTKMIFLEYIFSNSRQLAVLG